MSSKTVIMSLCLSVWLSGCGGGGGGGGDDSGNVDAGAGATDLYMNIATEPYVSELNLAGDCAGASSKWRTDNFIVGTSDGVSDEKMKEAARIAENTFTVDINRFGFDAWSDFGVDYENPLEICVLESKGSNGSANNSGFTIGSERHGNNLDVLVQHEAKHIYQIRLMGPAGQSHTWFTEGSATFLTTNEEADYSDLNIYLADVEWAPTQVTIPELHLLALTELRSDAYGGYATYNSTLHYLQAQGLTEQNVWDIYRTIGDIEASCRADQLFAFENDNNPNMVAPIDSETSCMGSDDYYKSGATKWHGEIISRFIEDHRVEVHAGTEPGHSAFFIAFNEVMAPYGISYDDIDDEAAFRATVMARIQ